MKKSKSGMTVYNTLALGENNVAFYVDGNPMAIKSIEPTKDFKALKVTLEYKIGDAPRGIKPKFKTPQKSQTEAIKEYLLQGHCITPLEALEMFGCFRLGARIADLKKQGMDIQNDNLVDERTGKRYARYRLSSVK